MNTTAKPPFFIVGCPRSGTTLLQVLIDEHPDIAIPPESFVFQRFGELFDAYGSLADPANLRLLVKDLLADARIWDWGLDVTPDSFCGQLRDPSVAGVLDLLFSLYARGQGKTRWGDKTPHHALCLQRIRAVFPAAKFIHLVRDGRDVAESMSRIFIGPISVYGIAGRWRRFVLACHAFKQTLPAEDFLEVRYEDLVHGPDEVRAGVFRFLGETAPDLAGAGASVPDTSAKRQATGAVAHHSSLNQAISTAKVGIFKTRFTAREIEIFEAEAGDALRLYNYPLCTSNPANASAYERWAARLQDGVFRYYRKLVRPSLYGQILKELKLELQDRRRKRARLRRGGNP
ncbi:MAG: sulfotransferase [Kiritimatiellae bacterium]|nr:sulfotransferase [Kiritimatiellia bacterium]